MKKLYYVNLGFEEGMYVIEHTHGYYNDEITSWESTERVHYKVLQSIIEIDKKVIKFLMEERLIEQLITMFKGEPNEEKDEIREILESYLEEIKSGEVDGITKEEYENELFHEDVGTYED